MSDEPAARPSGDGWMHIKVIRPEPNWQHIEVLLDKGGTALLAWIGQSHKGWTWWRHQPANRQGANA